MRLFCVSAAGVALFSWPFWGLGLPAAAPALALALAAFLALAAMESGTRRLDNRALALLAVLAALDAGLRLVLVTGIGGFSPMFLLILCAGYVFGGAFGFLVGAASLLVSGIATGGVGPWLPYEMFAAGWVGLAAGLAGRTAAAQPPSRRDLCVLAGVGIVAGFAYGAVMYVWDWTFFRGDPGIGWVPGMAPSTAMAHYGRFYLTTSVAYDAFRAGGNAVMVLALGRPVLLAMRRFRTRFSTEWVAGAVSAACSVGERVRPGDQPAAGSG